MAFGNSSGGLWLLGKIIVAVAGTPVALSQNVSTKTATAANPTQPPMCAGQLIFKCPSANVGNTYICYKGGSKNAPNSIICDIAPGGFFNLAVSFPSNPFRPDD